jgi:hypothetical protein
MDGKPMIDPHMIKELVDATIPWRQLDKIENCEEFEKGLDVGPQRPKAVLRSLLLEKNQKIYYNYLMHFCNVQRILR